MKLNVNKREKKLTQLLSTNNEYMTFSSYYLWFLMDRCHFIIDDIKWISIWSKHNGFEPFVTKLTEKRNKAKVDKNNGLEMFCKTKFNGSY